MNTAVLLNDRDKGVPPDGRIRARHGPGRIAFFIDRQGVVRPIVEGLPDNRKVIADIERILE